MTHDSTPFYPELVDRYITLLGQSTRVGNDEVGVDHLIWMLETIRDDSTQSITKKHRWLGYVQCALILEHKLTTVETERDFTRTIFNGE